MSKKHAPISALFADDAKPLIGRLVLCDQDKEGLGYWATLVRIENSSKPFVCVLNNPANAQGAEPRWRWVVEYEL